MILQVNSCDKMNELRCFRLLSVRQLLESIAYVQYGSLLRAQTPSYDNHYFTYFTCDVGASLFDMYLQQ